MLAYVARNATARSAPRPVGSAEPTVTLRNMHPVPDLFRGHRIKSSLFFTRLHLSVFQYIRDSFACVSVTIRVRCVRHLLVLFLVIEELRKLVIDYLLRGADQLQRSRLCSRGLAPLTSDCLKHHRTSCQSACIIITSYLL